MPNPDAWKRPLKHGGLRVVVTGGRDYEDRDVVWRALDRIHAKHGILVVIHGACDERDPVTGERRLRGADRWADEWADARGIPKIPEPVTRGEWRQFGGYAGPRRNERMFVKHTPDLCVHLPGGTGTADCCQRAYDHGVLRYNPITNEVT